MHIRRLLFLAIPSLVTAGLALPAEAAASRESLHERRAARPSVTVPVEVVEGDRISVTVRVPRAAAARRVRLERETVNVLGTTSWEKASTRRASGRKTRFTVVVTGEMTGRFRAHTTYRNGDSGKSRPARSTVRSWTPLTDFEGYYSTTGVWGYATSFANNGVQYRGWGTYGGSYPSYETRYTLGRRCTALRGVAGLIDSSSDGTSASFTLVADDVTTVWGSGLLIPGTAQPFEVPIASPYRLAVRSAASSPAGTKTYPAIGSPEALCTKA